MFGSEPIYSFTSHIAGKNATVMIYPDRIEWDRKGMSGAVRHGLAAMTLGLSYAKTGIAGGGETEVIPMRSISSVTTKKGMMNTLVKIITSGNVIEMNVGHGEAQQIKDIVNGILAGGPPAPSYAPAVPVIPQPVQAPVSTSPTMDQLVQWHSSGALSDDEFAAAKRSLLGI